MDFTADLRRRYTSACSACVKDRYLKQIIKNKGKSGKCSACKTKANVFPVKRLAKLVQSIVRENFQKRVEMRIVGDYNYYMYEPISDDLDTVICKVMGEYSDFHNEIIGSLVEIEYAEAEKHRYEYFDELGFYVESPMSLPIQIKWENMLHELKHKTFLLYGR